MSRIINCIGLRTAALAVAILGSLLTNSAFSSPIPRTPVVVAVIDTGLDVQHPHIAPYLWTNSGETGADALGNDKAHNGVDDDHNGYVDDLHGWDFSMAQPDLTDHSGHGTHIAGIVATLANTQNKLGAGARPVRLMGLKYHDTKNVAASPAQGLVNAIRYAVAMRADIINISGGGVEPVSEELTALKEAERKGILVVAASGNKSPDARSTHFYPANYPLKNILSVTASDAVGSILPTSNAGAEFADIAAPGYHLRSSLPKNHYGTLTGTSQAAAYVSGLAVKIIAERNLHEAIQIKAEILKQGTQAPVSALMLDPRGMLSQTTAIDLGLAQEKSGLRWVSSVSP